MPTIKSFPNNADEYIGAENVMKWLHGRTSGVFGAESNLAVTADEGLSVSVSDGIGWIANDEADGTVFWNDSEQANGTKLSLPIELPDAIYPRIDRVVVSWETINYVKKPSIEILKGTAASSPVPPSLTNDNLKRQISLAQIYVPAAASKISPENITDERLNDDVCGLVTAGIGVDTSVMQDQFLALLSKIESELARLNAGTETMLKTDYDPDLNIKESGGIKAYTAAQLQPVQTNLSGLAADVGNLKYVLVSLPASGWSGSAPYTQTVSVSGMTADWVPGIPTVVLGSSVDVSTLLAATEALGCIKMITSADGTLTFTAPENKPGVSLTMRVPGQIESETTKTISILNAGVDVSNITGGWKTGASWGYSNNIVSPTLNFSNGAMNITYPDKNIAFGGITTQNSIDLTNYSSIEIFVKSACAIGKSYPSDGGGAALNIAIGKSYTKTDYSRVIVSVDRVTNQRIILDLTDAVGKYYIGICATAYVHQPLSLNASITDIILRGWSV